VRPDDGTRAFLEPAEEHGTEVHRPDAVGDFLEADVLACEHMAAVDPAAAAADAAVGTDEPDLVVRGVDEGREAAGIGPGGGRVERPRGLLAQRFVGPLSTPKLVVHKSAI
jgi:hypothetical protein